MKVSADCFSFCGQPRLASSAGGLGFLCLLPLSADDFDLERSDTKDSDISERCCQTLDIVFVACGDDGGIKFQCRCDNERVDSVPGRKLTLMQNLTRSLGNDPGQVADCDTPTKK